MNKVKTGLFTLAAGTFGFGIVEYGMMSILPDLAISYEVSISGAGRLISSYALGVCAGAPLVAFFLRNAPLKRILLLLMCVYAVGNLMFAVSETFQLALVARFISGMPHGAFFGTGAIVASRLMPGRATTSVAIMVMGMTVANFLGVPIGSFLANNFSWRWIFFFATGWGIMTAVCCVKLIGDVGSLAHSSAKGVFRFLRRPAPWILIGATMLCNGGAFAMYSYVSPVMVGAGMSVAAMPVMMLLVGGSMCVGNMLGGTLSDRFSPLKVSLAISIIMTVTLLATYFTRMDFWLAGASVVCVAGALFAISSPMQLLLIEYSKGGELMGGAMVQVAFNLGNAIGAFLGGLPLAHGQSAGVTGLVGATLSGLAIPLLGFFLLKVRSAKRIDTGK